MIYRVFIVCLFLILCIFLIYFALKNKQIETFQEKIIVKSVQSIETDLQLFSYNETSKIKHVNNVNNKVQAIFPDLPNVPTSPIIESTTPTDVIQIIYVLISNSGSGGSSNSFYKKIILKNTGKVYDGSTETETEIDDLSYIIQIAPTNDGNFIALTSYNTLKRCEYSSSNFDCSSIEFTGIPSDDDPIVSIQGFIKSPVYLFLTMSGKLYKTNAAESSPMRITDNDHQDTENVIQFSIPTYSDYADDTYTDMSTPYSYIKLNDSTGMKTVVFNDGTTSPQDGTTSPKTIPSQGALTTVIIENGTNNYNCYVVVKDHRYVDKIYLFQFINSSKVFSYGSGNSAPLIDVDILNIIAVKDTLYYIKFGGIYCDGLEGSNYFSLGNQCVTCGENAYIYQDGTTDQCKCDVATPQINKHTTHEDVRDIGDAFTATADNLGCLDYGDCPQLSSDECGNGLWYKENAIDNPKSADELVSGEDTPVKCPACMKCSRTASEAVSLGGIGSIKYGDSHTETGYINDGEPCADGNVSPGCQYYVQNSCTPTTDTVFAKRTLVNEAPGARQTNDDDGTPIVDDFGVYISEIDGDQYLEGSVNNEAVSATRATDVGILGTPSSSSPYSYELGSDDTWVQCISRNCCETDSGSINEKIGYNCTDGNKRVCDNCSYTYSCSPPSSLSEDIFNINFSLPGEPIEDETHLNYRLDRCGQKASDTETTVYSSIGSRADICDRLGGIPSDCPVDGVVPSSSGTSTCPGLFPSSCTPSDVDFTNCDNLFP